MILHIINTAPLKSQALSKCIAAFGHDDRVLFIEDGVYHCLSELPSILSTRCHFLKNDISARGLCQHVEPKQQVDDNGFVELVALCKSSTNWS
jgi:sulfur relay protein TusB/DsrH